MTLKQNSTKSKSTKIKRPKTSATAQTATPEKAPDSVTLDAFALLDMLIPGPFNSGTPALTMLDQVADELQAISHAREAGGTGEEVADALLYRLQVRVRAVSDFLGRTQALYRIEKEVR